MTNHEDRAVQALIDDGWTGAWDWAIGPDDLVNGVALVLRVVRDDMALAWLEGEIYDLSDAERWLNKRITALTGKKSLTGDTTEERAS